MYNRFIKSIVNATPNNQPILFTFDDVVKMNGCLSDFKEVYKDKKIVTISHSCDDYDNETIESCDFFVVEMFERYLNLNYKDVLDLIKHNKWQGLNINAKIVFFGCPDEEFKYSDDDSWVLLRPSIFTVKGV